MATTDMRDVSPLSRSGLGTLAGMVRSKQTQQKQQTIPWYIIDPTGEFITAQRAANAAKKRRAFTTRGSSTEAKEDMQVIQQTEHARAKALAQYSRSSTAGFQRLTLERRGSCKWPTLYPTWDVIGSLALVFTAFATPYEVGFLPPAEHWYDWLFLVNRGVDAVFIFDMIFSFLTMTKSPVTGDWEMDVGVLARQYLRGWFLIDLVSIIPSAFDIIPVVTGGSTQGGTIKVLRTVRSLRLIKLLRIIRSSRIIDRYRDSVPWSNETTTILQLACTLFVSFHFYACTMAISTTLAPSPLDTWLATHGYCAPLNGTDANGERLYECVEPAYIYLQALRWAMGLLVGGGFPMFPRAGPYGEHFSASNRYQQPFTWQEDILTTLLKLIGIFQWSVMFSRLIKVVNEGDRVRSEYNSDVDKLNRFCNYNNLPGSMARDLRKYMRETMNMRRAQSRAAIMACLSPRLAIETSSFINQQIMDAPCFYYLKNKSETGREFVRQLLLRMTPHVYAPKDYLPKGHLFYIEDGYVQRQGKAHGPGSLIGELDVVLQTPPPHVINLPVTYLHVQAIDRETFRKLAREFPKEYNKMRCGVLLRWSGRQIIMQNRKPPAKKVLRGAITRTKSSIGRIMVSKGDSPTQNMIMNPQPAPQPIPQPITV